MPKWLLIVGAAAAGLWLFSKKKEEEVESMPTVDDELRTETGQKVEVVYNGPAGVQTPDFLQIVPSQIYWSDAFLQEVWDRQNSFAARVGAYDLDIYLQKETGLRQVGKLLTNGEYWPTGSPRPLDVASLAYEQERPPFWS